MLIATGNYFIRMRYYRFLIELSVRRGKNILRKSESQRYAVKSKDENKNLDESVKSRAEGTVF